MGRTGTATKLDQDTLAAFRELVEACEYVKPFAGAVAVTASVKNIRQAGRFVKAVENAKRILEESARDGGSAFHSAMLQEIGRRVFLAEMPDGKIKYWPTKRRKTST